MYWFGMKNEIMQYIENCTTCSKWKQPVTKTPLTPILAEKPRERLLIDFSEVEEDALGYKWLLLVIDSFTKYVWGDAFPTKESAPAARFLLKIFLSEGNTNNFF